MLSFSLCLVHLYQALQDRLPVESVMYTSSASKHHAEAVRLINDITLQQKLQNTRHSVCMAARSTPTTYTMAGSGTESANITVLACYSCDSLVH
jgi:hypothetical protein